MAKLLCVDDDRSVLFALREILVDRGHDVATATSGKDALAPGLLDDIEAVVTDLAMPGMDGLALLKQIHDRDGSLPVILLTAHGSERVAVEAMKAGAYDYVAKPFDIDEIGLVVERAVEARRLRVQTRQLSAEQAIGRRIVGESSAMRRLLEAVARVADKDVTVLVRGETGTGKELVASLLHAQSKRAKKPLVRFNCAAIPGELAEAELFGHAKGAFTGAQGARRGFFSMADGGTLVLDEIGELSLAVQAKLLRALQEGEIQPVGSGRVEHVDVRIVASTNRDLAAEARAGRFREDLYYRLAVVELRLPALRERREDVPLLATEFGRRYAEKFGLEGLVLSPALLEKLSRSEWPGNVRQLENAIARIAALSQGGEVDADTFDDGSPTTHEPREDTGSTLDGPSLREQVEAFERNLIAHALNVSGGNQSEAARRLSTSRPTLIDKIKKYRLGSEPG